MFITTLAILFLLKLKFAIKETLFEHIILALLIVIYILSIRIFKLTKVYKFNLNVRE